MVIKEIYEKIRDILRASHTEDSDFDAMCVAEDILCVSRAEMLAFPEREVPAEKADRALKAADRRAAGYPLQYILGKWEFYGLTFRVGEGVLIPRPETELLVDTVLEFFKGREHEDITVTDLCSGSGCIAIALKNHLKNAEIFAVENSSDAMPYLAENVISDGRRVKIIKGDVFDGRLLDNFADRESEGDYKKVSCIVSNPPYVTSKEMESLQEEVKHEPSYALDGGIDGLKYYRVISCLWSEILEDGGLLAFETGETQGAAVKEIMEKNGFENVKIRQDYSGHDRVVYGKKMTKK